MIRAIIIIEPAKDTELRIGMFSVKTNEAIGKVFETYCHEEGVYRSEVMFSTKQIGMNDETEVREICKKDELRIHMDLVENEFRL